MLITTTETLQGIEIESYLGLVMARVPDAKAASLKKKYEQSTADLKREVSAALEKAAQEIGADAVIGVRMESESLSALVIGTAVRLKR
ncbi:MAG: YbjQ family protein [Oscillospiraceae bacterium]|nr:YbjQ family protein [Oscillospiraceae bacterium]